MQPTPQEAMSMPQNTQAPMQPTAPVPPAMPNSYGQNPSPSSSEQLSAAALARARANILAQAIIEAQNFASNAPQAQATQLASPEMQEPASSDPTETEEKMNKTSSGERVIQPIHDPRIQQQREDMAKKMAELLGDEEYQPMQIDTNTAKHMQASATMTVPNATQASEAIPQVAQQQVAPQQPQQMAPYQQIMRQPEYQPTAQMQLAPTPQVQPQQMVQQPMPPQAASGQAIYSQMMQTPQFANTSQNVMAQMQQPVVQYQQASTQQSMDPRTAAIKMQALQAEEERRMQVGQAEINQAEQEALAAQQEALQLQAQAQQARALADQKAQQEQNIQEQLKAEHDAEVAAKQAEEQQRAQALAAQQQPATTDDQPKTLFSQLRSRAQHNNMRVNPDVVKKAADATILVSQKTPADEPVQVIQPAYIQALETQLATDMQEKEKSSKVGSQMAAELANDKITLEASKIKVEAPKQAEEAELADATPDAVLAAMQNVMTSSNLESNPNIKNG